MIMRYIWCQCESYDLGFSYLVLILTIVREIVIGYHKMAVMNDDFSVQIVKLFQFSNNPVTTSVTKQLVSIN